MRARLVLEIMVDDGETIATETVADLVKVTKGAGDLGLSLSEANGEHKKVGGLVGSALA
ncbi:hypothetical protein [Mesorhizobium sp. M0244]|uniref:hypothetical protein n=1 Tax=Mesorhizobium sp. M0244 TaxID=2956926 RepID=UPI00333D94AC